jgi:hypothetical protein
MKKLLLSITLASAAFAVTGHAQGYPNYQFYDRNGNFAGSVQQSPLDRQAQSTWESNQRSLQTPYAGGYYDAHGLYHFGQ